jgi:hypothetical protein
MSTLSLSTILVWRGGVNASQFYQYSSSCFSHAHVPSLSRSIQRPSFSFGLNGLIKNSRGSSSRMSGSSSSSRSIIIATSYPSPTSRTFTTSTSLQATSRRITPTPTEDQSSSTTKKKKIPTILLAGFLGSGKTTTLKHLLENNSNIKIGTIVNDVASVNIDAKLISSEANNVDSYNAGGGVVELQNGCACCSLADELFTSIMTLTKGGERELDAIVVELRYVV